MTKSPIFSPGRVFSCCCQYSHGSAVALRHLLVSQLAAEVTIAYCGIIGRAENRALVKYLDHPLQPYAKGNLAAACAVILVDTQPGAGNSPLRKMVDIAAVIDHHPWYAQTAATGFFDVRPEVGATSTILTEYFLEVGLDFPPHIATALFTVLKVIQWT